MTAALLVLAAALAAPGWWGPRRVLWWLLPVLACACLGLAGISAVAGWQTGGLGHAATAGAGMVAALVGGGPVTMAVLRSVSGRTDLNVPGRHEAGADDGADDGDGDAPGDGGGDVHGRGDVRDDVLAAADVLRGGAWIGALERLAVTATLAAGWPEGLAVVLAVKGLGRYPELRRPGAAERFIIGTLSSVLWAAACAGVISLR